MNTLIIGFIFGAVCIGGCFVLYKDIKKLLKKMRTNK